MTSDPDAVLKLGRDLADALDRSDIVGRWLAHHLADLITRCGAAPEDEELGSTTRDVILTLWQHKSGGRFRREPYGYVRPVLKVLERLEPDPEPWAFYRTFSDSNKPPANELSAYPLLLAACDVDREAAQLIRLAVAVASKDAISREEPWVIAGAALAKSEEDRVVQLLDQYTRRIRLEAVDAQTSVEASLEAEPEAVSVVETTESSADFAPDVSAATGEQVDREEVLILALRASIDRCRRLMDQLSEMSSALTNASSERTPIPMNPSEGVDDNPFE